MKNKTDLFDASNGAGIKGDIAPRPLNTTCRIKKILFIEIPQIMGFNNSSKRPDFLHLAQNLRAEFTDIFAFASFQKWQNLTTGAKILPTIYQSLSLAGIYPILTPTDPDPIIATKIITTAYQEKNSFQIGLLSGDTGYYYALAEAKKVGSTIKVIFPNKQHSLSLKTIADEILVT